MFELKHFGTTVFETLLIQAFVYPLSQINSYPVQHVGALFTHVFVQSNPQVPCKNIEVYGQAHLGAVPPTQTLLQPSGQVKL